MSCPQVIEVVTPGPPGPAADATTLTGPAVIGRASGTGSTEILPIGSGLVVTGGALTAPGADLSYNASTRQLSSSTGADTTLPLAGADAGLLAGVTFAGPSGWTVSGAVSNGSITLSLALPAGASLVAPTDRTNWDAAYSERLRWNGEATGLNAATGRASLGLGSAAQAGTGDFATAAQGAKADTAVQPAGLAGYVQTNDARLSDARAPLAHTQSAATITGLATVATSGAYADLSGRPTLGTAAALNVGTGAGNVMQLDGSGRLPAVDGSQLTNLPAGSGTVSSVGLSAPTGFSVSSSPVTTSGTLSLTFAAGYSLPTNAAQTEWNAAYAERLRWDGGSTGLVAATARASLGLGTAAITDASAYAAAAQGAKADTAVQPAALTGYVQTSDSRLSDAREWSAATVSQADAEAGTATDRRAWTVQRVWQAIAAWWTTNSTAAGRALVTAADAAAQRTALGLGTAATTAASAYATAAQGALAATAAQQGAITSSGLTMATARILARSTAGTGAVEEHTLPTGFDLSSGALRAPAEIGLACSDETTALTTGAGKITFRMPYAMTLTAVRLSVTTAPTGSALIVDVNEGGVSVFSTNPRIDAGSTTSVGSATPAVISDAALADNAVITIDIDQIGATVAGAGLKVWLIGRRV